ncbi:hypothetical protein [Saccharicrinis sp. FJH54]|uniref:hypothetical protein n=1 Tax=Saccharicrinis sp. FJH54 TaxID=3344665 RepID=UPI0035D3E821
MKTTDVTKKIEEFVKMYPHEQITAEFFKDYVMLNSEDELNVSGDSLLSFELICDVSKLLPESLNDNAALNKIKSRIGSYLEIECIESDLMHIVTSLHNCEDWRDQDKKNRAELLWLFKHFVELIRSIYSDELNKNDIAA